MKHSQDAELESRNASQASAPDERAIEPVNSSRRRFTRAGLSGSVLMTLASRPALANHCSVSGAFSGNLSRAPHTVPCAGLAPVDWRVIEDWGNCGYDPGTCADSTNTPCQIWTGGTTIASLGLVPDYVGQTMMQAMWEQPTGLLAHISAGYLNACRFGEEAYGYSTTSFATFISRATDPAALLNDLLKLNSSGSRV